MRAPTRRLTAHDPGGRLRVSFVADTENWGGAESWLVHHLRRAPGHRVHASVVAAQEVADRFRPLLPGRDPTRVAAVPLVRHASDAPATQAALEAQRPDVVLLNLVDPASNAASIRAATAVAPTAAVLHLPGTVGSGRPRLRLAEAYAGLAVVLAPSQAGADLVLRHLAEPRHGVVVSCNGVDIPDRPQGPACGLPPRVGGLGRFTKQKGFDILLAATRLLLERGVELEVVLGGAGREEAALRRDARDLPVTFTGWVAEPRAFLAGLDIFCLPSRQEALPLSLLEAMAEGLPCVATDVGDIRARVGGPVQVVPPEDPATLADALETLLADPARRARLAMASRRRVAESHDAAGMVATTYAVLREVTAADARMRIAVS